MKLNQECVMKIKTLYLEKNLINVNSRDQARGQTLTEYALILGLLAVVLASVLVILGDDLTNYYSRINSNLNQANIR